jgi:ATP-binding protein involved in chromosome partitioning
MTDEMAAAATGFARTLVLRPGAAAPTSRKKNVMSPSREAVLERLRRVKGPDLKGNIVDLGLVSEVLLKDGRVSFSITVPAERATQLEELRQAAEKVVREMDGVKSVLAVLTAERAPGGNGATTAARLAPRPAAPAPGVGTPRQLSQIAGIKHMLAVASGKGGVGKSTTAVNLALGLQAIGLATAILDADIYGPSQPRLLGLRGRPQVAGGKTLLPMEAYGLKAMSIGFLVDEASPMIWRGPMAVQALTQMLREVAWGDLDVLVIDMPPGTGDVHLTMAQQVPLSGAIIVSTPQDLALIDARKGLNMFRKVNVPVLGIIENMSYFECPKCGERSDIFGHGGARMEAEKLGVPFLGSVPLDMEIRATSDEGRPIVASHPDGVHAGIYREIAARAWEQLEAGAGAQARLPGLEVSADRSELIVAFPDAAPFTLPAEMLRVLSPSAEVQGHSPDQRVTVPRKRNVKIKDLRPVGSYAVRIVFDDGHDTGLYAWSYLETLHRDREKVWAEYLSELAVKGLSRG